MRTPLTIVTGSLGSGKTTLLRHILAKPDRKIAIIMNEFGEIGIDGKILQGKNVQIAELGGGCVCCSLLGEFELAVDEIIQGVNPDHIIVETTGVAEPDALIFNIQESLPQVRLDGVITIVDADSMIRFPTIGKTLQMQIEDADLLILNKEDLVSIQELQAIKRTLTGINPHSPIIPARFSRVDTDLLFGIDRNKKLKAPTHRHQIEFQTFTYRAKKRLDPEAFARFAAALPQGVARAKGFVNFPKGTFLFNFVSGRWELEPFEKEETELVFIGKELDRDMIMRQLDALQIP